MTIYFYSPRDDYGFLSNFSVGFSFMFNGRLWRTSEHAYQAMKFEGTKHYDIIWEYAITPKQAAKAGRNKNRPLRSDWERVKLKIMYDVLKCKFNDNKNIAVMLKETGNEKLVEASPIDYYWGCGYNGNGKNYLGKILMRVREEL